MEFHMTKAIKWKKLGSNNTQLWNRVTRFEMFHYSYFQEGSEMVEHFEFVRLQNHKCIGMFSVHGLVLKSKRITSKANFLLWVECQNLHLCKR